MLREQRTNVAKAERQNSKFYTILHYVRTAYLVTVHLSCTAHTWAQDNGGQMGLTHFMRDIAEKVKRRIGVQAPFAP